MVYTERNFYMELYELDKRDDDEKVTRLRFPTLSTRVSCSGNWNCTGTTSWKSPRSGHRNVTAQTRMKVKYRAR